MDKTAINKMIIDIQDRLLSKLGSRISMHYFDRPVSEFSNEDIGFEKGLSKAEDEIQKIAKELLD